MKRFHIVKICAIALAILVACGAFAQAQAPAISIVASTIPANGDLNPYGVARVPVSTGALVEGNILVSNFNNSMNWQGTGTTIVQISPTGNASLFAQINASSLPAPCPGGVGLTTALGVLRTGWVIVGSLPTSDGTSATAHAGCLLVLNNWGAVVETFYGSLINGPWDMATLDQGSSVTLFVTNVLNGTQAGNGKVVHGGTVVRLGLSVSSKTMPSLQSMTVIGSGFAEETNSVALVIGPTGVGIAGNLQNLYVADTLNNRIAAIPDPIFRTTSAGTGATVSQGGSLNGPLGLEISPGGDILAANGGNGYMVTTTPDGNQISKVLLDSTGDPPGAGALFGLVPVAGQGLYYVDDNTNTLNLYN